MFRKLNWRPALRRINWRYALGEILIVIIGITIAFSLNRWGENNNDRKLRSQYLRSLEVDIRADKEHLTENIAAFEAKLADIHDMLPALHGDTARRSALSGKLFKLANLVYFHPHDITYRTLVNTGNIRLIGDFEVNKRLEEYYATHSRINRDYRRQESIHEKYFGHFIIHNIDYDRVRAGDYSYMDDPLLRSIVYSLMGTFQIAIQTSREGIAESEQLLAYLDKQLNY